MASTVTQLNNSPIKRIYNKKTFMATIFFSDSLSICFSGFYGLLGGRCFGPKGWLDAPGMNPGMMSGPQGMRGEERMPVIPDDEHHLWGNLRELGS